jgi:hypothetical protein
MTDRIFTTFEDWAKAAKDHDLSDPKKVQGFEQYEVTGETGQAGLWNGNTDTGVIFGVEDLSETVYHPTHEDVPHE